MTNPKIYASFSVSKKGHWEVAAAVTFVDPVKVKRNWVRGSEWEVRPSDIFKLSHSQETEEWSQFCTSVKGELKSTLVKNIIFFKK